MCSRENGRLLPPIPLYKLGIKMSMPSSTEETCDTNRKMRPPVPLVLTKSDYNSLGIKMPEPSLTEETSTSSKRFRPPTPLVLTKQDYHSLGIRMPGPSSTEETCAMEISIRPPAPLSSRKSGCYGSSERKKRKIQPVRKQLFKKPPKLSTPKASSRNSIGKRRKTQVQKLTVQDSFQNITPLILIDEAEELICSKSSVITPTRSSSLYEDPIKNLTPDSAESNLEFLKLEEACAVDSSEESVKSVKTSHVRDKIETLLQRSNDQFMLLQGHVQEILEKYSQEQKAIIKEVIELIKCDDQSLVKDCAPIKPSLKTVKDVDLRKAILSKNVTEQLKTPRTKRAVDTYNSLRGNCSVLCTPHMEQTDTLRNHSNITESLSKRLQNQCLLLHDTPRK